MTRIEWDRIAAVLDNGFPGHFGEAESATYWLLLGRRPARQVEQAVRRAVDSGARYRPTPSELVRLMRNETVALTPSVWVERYVAMYGDEKGKRIAGQMLGEHIEGGIDSECHSGIATS